MRPAQTRLAQRRREPTPPKPRTGDVVFWSDADAFFNNFDVALHEYVATTGADFVFSHCEDDLLCEDEMPASPDRTLPLGPWTGVGLG